VARKAHQRQQAKGPHPLLLAVGSLVAVLLVFLLLPLAGGFAERKKPDLRVRDVDLIELPEPPEEESPVNEETEHVPEVDSRPEWSDRSEVVPLAPLVVDSAGPPMPAVSAGDLAVPAFPLAETPSLMPGTFGLNEVDVRPVPLVQKPPVYPWEMRRARREGYAVMTYTIDVEGRTSEIAVESASHEAFGQAATEAVRQWRYRPARRGGEAVACLVRIEVPFNLR